MPLNQGSDRNGYEGDPLNQLWDTHTDDVTGAIAAGDTSYTVRSAAGWTAASDFVHIRSQLMQSATVTGSQES